MTLQSVPDHQELTGNMTQQVVKKLDDLGTADAAPKQSKVEAPPSYPRHGGQCFPIEVVLQHGCLAPWSPRTAAVRALTQSTFVDEDDSPIFVFGFFFNSGQRSRFQRLIFSSSRSKARPVGRWQLQPSCRRMRQAWEGSYCTPHSCSIRSATRADVHRWVSYPRACGPRFNPLSTRRKSSLPRRGLRPARPAFFRARRPCCCSCSAHRLTDCRCTPGGRPRPGCIPFRAAAPLPAGAALTCQNLCERPLDYPCGNSTTKQPIVSLYYSILHNGRWVGFRLLADRGLRAAARHRFAP